MRQVIGNAKLATNRIRWPQNQLPNAFKGKIVVQNWQCSKKVADCGKTPSGGGNCHRFYKCINGINGFAVSCQNPKLFQSKCSEKYWGKGGKAKYKCWADTVGEVDCKPREIYSYHILS